MTWVRNSTLGIKATGFADNSVEEKVRKAKAWQSKSSSDSRKAVLKRDR